MVVIRLIVLPNLALYTFKQTPFKIIADPWGLVGTPTKVLFCALVLSKPEVVTYLHCASTKVKLAFPLHTDVDICIAT